jgi:hypothetical protein
VSDEIGVDKQYKGQVDGVDLEEALLAMGAVS